MVNIRAPVRHDDGNRPKDSRVEAMCQIYHSLRSTALCRNTSQAAFP